MIIELKKKYNYKEALTSQLFSQIISQDNGVSFFKKIEAHIF